MKFSPSLKRLVLPLCVAGCAMTLLVAALAFAAHPPTLVASWAGRGVALLDRARDALVTRADAAWMQARASVSSTTPQEVAPARAVQAAWQAA